MSGWRTPCLGIRVLCDRLTVDVLEIAFHEPAARPVADVRADLGFIPKSEHALAAGSPGTFDLDGMSGIQQEYAASLNARTDGGSAVQTRFTQEIRLRCDHLEALVELLVEWDRAQAATDVMGDIVTRLLADR